MNPFSNKWLVVGVVVTVLIQLFMVYVLPQTGFNPLRTAPFPAEWWLFIILLALPVLFVIEFEELMTERLRKYFKR